MFWFKLWHLIQSFFRKRNKKKLPPTCPICCSRAPNNCEVWRQNYIASMERQGIAPRRVQVMVECRANTFHPRIVYVRIDGKTLHDCPDRDTGRVME